MIPSLLKELFSKRFFGPTLLVMAACAVMLRLGFWQLDRLGQRQAANTEIRARLVAPPLTATELIHFGPTRSVKFRAAVVRGRFDYAQTVVLEEQQWQGQPGVHLLTPLLIEGREQAVLIDRGWIPVALAESRPWTQFQTDGRVEITGRVQASQPRPAAPPLVAPERRIFRVDLDRLQDQLPYPLLPVFIAQSPASGQTVLPVRRPPDLQLSNGPHLGYAIQWFVFAVMLAGGYLKYIRQYQRPVSVEKPVPFSKPIEA